MWLPAEVCACRAGPTERFGQFGSVRLGCLGLFKWVARGGFVHVGRVPRDGLSSSGQFVQIARDSSG